MHPLVNNLSALKDVELENKIQSLTRNYFFSQNPQVKEQIVMILDDYKNELAVRRSKQLQSEYQKRDKDLDNLIKVD